MLSRLSLVLLLAACADEVVTADPVSAEPRLSAIQVAVFTPSCAGFVACHDDVTPAGELNLLADVAHAQLVERHATMAPSSMLVLPGDPDASFLVAKLRGELAADQGDPMPWGNPPLTPGVMAQIEEWIARGAADD
jgi:hypothetical protein